MNILPQKVTPPERENNSGAIFWIAVWLLIWGACIGGFAWAAHLAGRW